MIGKTIQFSIDNDYNVETIFTGSYTLNSYDTYYGIRIYRSGDNLVVYNDSMYSDPERDWEMDITLYNVRIK